MHATRHLSWNWTSCFKVWAFLQKLNRKTEKQKVFGKRWLLGKCSFFYRRSPIAGSSGTGPLISCPSRLVCGSRQALASFPHERETTETEFQWGARKAFLLLLLRSFLSFVSTASARPIRPPRPILFYPEQNSQADLEWIIGPKAWHDQSGAKPSIQ